MRILTVIAAILALMSAASAQTPSAATEADPIYHVEIIVYAFNEGSAAEENLHHGAEDRLRGPVPELLTLPPIEIESVFDLPASGIGNASPGPEATPPGAELVVAPPDTLTEPAGDGLELIERSGSSVAYSGRSSTLPPEFRPLRRSELQLDAERRTLDRLSAYTVLAHTGWAQAGLDDNRSVPLDIGMVGISNPRGTIDVYLGRFLHARMNLEFLTGRGSFWRPTDRFRLAPFEYAESFRLDAEVNAMRSDGPPHLVDHPLYGVLIQITRPPEPEDTSASGATGRPAG